MIRLAGEADIARLCEIERSAATLFAGTHMAWAADAPGAPPQSYRDMLKRGSIWGYEADRRLVGFIAVWPERTNRGLRWMSDRRVEVPDTCW